MKRTILILLALIAIQLTAQAQIGLRGRQNTNGSSQNSDLSYTRPQEVEIADISVSGIEFLDKNALIALTGLKVGDKIRIPGDDISNAIEKLWNHGIIGDAGIYITKKENGQVWLDISLKERPRLSRILFSGVTKTEEANLDEQIGLIRGRVVTDALIKNTELTVKRYYIDKGYLNVSTRINTTNDTLVANSVKLDVNVDKGKRVKINRIIFHGNDNFDDGKLKGRLKETKEHARISLHKALINYIAGVDGSFFDSTYDVSGQEVKHFFQNNVKLNFFNSSKYIPSEIKPDLENIITFYNGKGYRDAQVVKDTVYQVSDDRVNVEIWVDEGQRYYFRDIIWTGNYVYNDQLLDNVLGVEKGDVYDMELINKKLSFNPSGTDISSLYQDNGYLFSNIQPVEVQIDEDSIDIEMRVYEGPQATINKITITGNDRTSDHVILREIRTYPGQKYNRSEIIRTQQLLSQLGYFDPEQIGINPMPNPANETVDIEYSLVESPTDQVQLSGGWGGPIGFVGTLGLTINNFSLRNAGDLSKWKPLPKGDGQRLSIQAQANGPRFQNYSFSFTEPWLGGRKPNSFTIGLNHSVSRTNFFDSDDSNDGFIKLYSASVSLGRRITWPDDYFVLTNSLSYQVYDLLNYGNVFTFPTGTATGVTLNTTLSRNSIDNQMFPSRGSTISMSLSLTPPYSLFSDKNYDELGNAEKYKWIEYHKWMIDAKYYIGLAKKLVLETRAHFGFIGSYGDKIGVGPFERFSVGGDGLSGQNFLLGTDVIGLRGYPNNSLTPPFDITDENIKGGVAFNKFVMEMRYALSTNPSATIYLLTFLEGGNNWGNYQEYNPFDMYRSAGFGARIFMPAFGLLGVDWGYGFDTVPGQLERSGPQFHFSIGVLPR